MTIDLILNRNASRLAMNGSLRRTLLAAASLGGVCVHETHTLPELDSVARHLARETTNGVILAGGDGSHMAGVSALARAFGNDLPPVAFAPCGTVCTIARNFGMCGTASAWTTRIIRAVCRGSAHIERKATLRVRDATGGNRVGFVFGAGLVTRFFDLYDRSSQRGLSAAAGIAARVFVGSFVGSRLARRVLAPIRCRAWIDGAPHPCREWSLILASVVRDVGLHLLATYRAGEALDRFHVVASGLPPRALGPQALRVLAGRPLRGEPRVDALAKLLRLSFEATGGAYVLDGDVFYSNHAQLEVGPLLPLLVPE